MIDPPPPGTPIPDPLVLRASVGAENDEDYRPVELATARGTIAARLYESAGSRLGAVWVGGAGGGFDSPAIGLYPDLARDLRAEDGVSSLRVRYRDSTALDEATFDVRAAVEFLAARGAEAVALTGHSFGGAVVIRAASRCPEVRAVVTLATQSFGAEPVAELGDRCPILLVHGTADAILPAFCSDHVARMARGPARVVHCEGAGHGLDECAEEIRGEIRSFLRAALGPTR